LSKHELGSACPESGSVTKIYQLESKISVPIENGEFLGQFSKDLLMVTELHICLFQLLVVWLLIQLFGYLYRFVCVKFEDWLEHSVQNLCLPITQVLCPKTEQIKKNLSKLRNEELRGFFSLNAIIMIKMRKIK